MVLGGGEGDLLGERKEHLVNFVSLKTGFLGREETLEVLQEGMQCSGSLECFFSGQVLLLDVLDLSEERVFWRQG